MIEVPILIVGGGPVGLTASSCYRSRASARCWSSYPGTAIVPKVCGINARTMEIYRQIGIEQAIRDAGLAPQRIIALGRSCTACPMISAGNRWSLWRARAAVRHSTRLATPVSQRNRTRQVDAAAPPGERYCRPLLKSVRTATSRIEVFSSRIFLHVSQNKHCPNGGRVGVKGNW